jgi:DNA-binding PadR family transcriptional regulator
VQVEYTILGVLMDQPRHGYSIKKTLLEIFSKSLGLNDGQLYPALARLEQRGWIKKRVVQQRRSPTKHLYRVTPSGEAAFFRWLAESESDGEPARYDFFWKCGFLQRCGFFRYLDAERVERQTEKKIEEVEERIAELESVLRRMQEKQMDPYRQMIIEYGIRYERMRREWLQDLGNRAMAQPPRQRRALGA